jgi:hypothetical protein
MGYLLSIKHFKIKACKFDLFSCKRIVLWLGLLSLHGILLPDLKIKAISLSFELFNDSVFFFGLFSRLCNCLFNFDLGFIFNIIHLLYELLILIIEVNILFDELLNLYLVRLLLAEKSCSTI